MFGFFFLLDAFIASRCVLYRNSIRSCFIILFCHHVVVVVNASVKFIRIPCGFRPGLRRRCAVKTPFINIYIWIYIFFNYPFGPLNKCIASTLKGNTVIILLLQYAVASACIHFFTRREYNSAICIQFFRFPEVLFIKLCRKPALHHKTMFRIYFVTRRSTRIFVGSYRQWRGSEDRVTKFKGSSPSTKKKKTPIASFAFYFTSTLPILNITYCIDIIIHNLVA